MQKHKNIKQDNMTPPKLNNSTVTNTNYYSDEISKNSKIMKLKRT
jgi:hypothetical protein